MSPKVRCVFCTHLKGERCEVRIKYMNPELWRWCLSFEAKAQAPLDRLLQPPP